jgi:hypothetical protein
MKHPDPFVRLAGMTAGLVLTAGFVVGCSTSTEPTVQLNFPPGTKPPEPYKGSGVVPGAGVMSQGNPNDYTK